MNYLNSNVLHTSYEKYGSEVELRYNENLRKNEVSSVVTILEEKERALYNKFGASNYEDFRDKIRIFFKETGNDKEVLARFSANNLEKELDRFASQTAQVFDQEIVVKINFEKIQNNSRYRKSAIESAINDTFQVTWNTKTVKNKLNIKDILNKVYKAHFSSERFTKEMEKAIEKLRAEEIISLNKIVGQNQEGDAILEEINFAIPNFPWGITKDMVNSVLDEKQEQLTNKNSKLYQELDRALNTIKFFIFEELGKGKSKILEEAMNAVWTEKMGRKNELVLLNFFSGSRYDNFKNAVKGALGEFQAAVIFKYVVLKARLNNFPIDITGDISVNGEQGKADIKLFEKMGVQVKNYSTTSAGYFLKDIETNIHPNNINSLKNNSNSNVLIFLANYYFNSDFQNNRADEFKTLSDFLQENYLASIMNFYDTSEEVSFYLISGKYLVPVSHIYENFYNNENNKIIQKLEITGPTNLKSDEDFKESREDKDAPKFTNYWIKKLGIFWEYREANEKKFKELINKDISLRVSFGSKHFKDLAYYSIF